MVRSIIILGCVALVALGVNAWQWSSHSKTKVELARAINTIDSLTEQSERNAALAANKTKALLAIKRKQREILNEVERLRRDDPEVKNWAERPLPASIKRLLNEKAEP